MAAELGGATGDEIVDHTLLERRYRVSLGIALPEKAQDVSDFPAGLVTELW
jgi:hypothetical protein